MAHTERTLTIPGIVLASAIHDFVANNGDTEGLIFGKVSSKKSVQVNDMQSEQQNTTETIAIQCFAKLGEAFSFYGADMIIDESKVVQLVRRHQGSVLLGWFKFRRNLPLRPSMMDLNIHAQLLKIWSGLSPLSMPYFALFTHSFGNEPANQFDYQFFQAARSAWEQVKLHIINLVHSSAAEYKEFTEAMSPLSLHPAPNESSVFGRLSSFLAYVFTTARHDALSDFVCEHSQGSKEAVSPAVIQLDKVYDLSLQELRTLAADVAKLEGELAVAQAQLPK